MGCARSVEEPASSQLSSDTAPAAAAARVRHSGSTKCIVMAPLMALRPGMTMTRPVDIEGRLQKPAARCLVDAPAAAAVPPLAIPPGAFHAS